MSIKDDKTPIYRCPRCYSALTLVDEENDIYRCTNVECLKRREVVVIIREFDVSAMWAWKDEQDLKAKMSKHGGGGHSGKRRKVKRGKAVRWYIVDRSVTERYGKQKTAQSVADEGASGENQDFGSNGGTESQQGGSETA